MTLLKVRHWDYNRGTHIQAFTDGFAHDESQCLCLLSVAGPDSAVKGITSAITTGREIEILADPTIKLRPSYWQKYRVFSAKLPSGFLHRIVALEGFFKSEGSERFLLVGPDQSPADLAFQLVQKDIATPLLPAWRQWLFEQLQEDEAIQELPGNLKVLQLCIDKSRLDALVSEGERSGEIQF